MKVYKSKKAAEEIRRTYDVLVSKWGVETEDLYLSSPYGTTHVLAAGNPENPPLILFHGVGDDSALMWIYNAAHLSGYFRLYAVDTIGGPGKSEPGAMYNKTFEDELWIDTILDALHIEKACFAGVSHGSHLVKVYACARPERVIKGVCISGSVSEGKGGSLLAMMKIFLPEALFPTPKNVNKLIKKLCGSRHAVFTDHPDIMEHYTWLLKGFNNMAMGFHKVRPFTENQIDALREKLEFLVGLEDPFQKLGGTEALKTCNMRATFYEDAGHGLNHELADEINRKLVSVLLPSET